MVEQLPRSHLYRRRPSESAIAENGEWVESAHLLAKDVLVDKVRYLTTLVGGVLARGDREDLVELLEGQGLGLLGEGMGQRGQWRGRAGKY